MGVELRKAGRVQLIMQKIDKLEQYKELMQGTKQRCGRGASNVYFMADEVGRYIAQGRLYAEEFDAGCVLYVDEHTHYNTVIYVADNAIAPIPARNKRCVFRYVYKGKDAEVTGQKFAGTLSTNGFHKGATSVEVRLAIEYSVENGKKVEKWVRKMEEQGFSCVCAEESQFQEIEEMICTSGVIKDYQMTYRTPEEKRALERGSYLCVLDKEGNMCAAHFCALVNGITTEGAVVVKEEYKMRGLVSMFTYYRSQWLKEHQAVCSQGWIETDNMPSIRMHKSLGYEFRDRYADEWILDALQ